MQTQFTKNPPKVPEARVHTSNKKDIVAVRRIVRQIPLMTSQVIHICSNAYSDVKTMIFILTRFNLVGQVSFSWQPAPRCYSIGCDLV